MVILLEYFGNFAVGRNYLERALVVPSDSNTQAEDACGLVSVVRLDLGVKQLELGVKNLLLWYKRGITLF